MLLFGIIVKEFPWRPVYTLSIKPQNLGSVKMRAALLLTGVSAIMALAASQACLADDIELAGDWKVSVSVPSKGLKAVFDIAPTEAVKVSDEKYGKLPDYNPKAWGGWQRGVPLNSLKGQECTIKSALDPLSLTVAPRPGGLDSAYVKGKDYEAEVDWGSVGRLPEGTIKPNEPVYISYSYTPQRIDSIVVDASGKALKLKPGKTDICLPRPPALEAGELRVANIYLGPGKTAKLTAANLFPVLEQEFPAELAVKSAGTAERLLPKAMKALKEGGSLKILAWGDSVTDGGFLPDRDKNRWQAQFVTRLKEKFPKAKIELVTEAWGGHNSTQYLAEPPGSIHNYKEKVLDVKPDLVVIEFVNDSWMKASDVEARYSKLMADFKEIGAEVILQTPHYIRPDWMGLSSQRDIDNDPREYVKTLRAFAEKNNIALSDCAARYGRLWRQGIPYNTLMSNNINHPCPEGMKLFADSLMALFQ